MPQPQNSDRTPEQETGIEARGLVREFKGGIRAVDGIDLRVRPGEIYGFLGPNGAGKSTTVHMLTTLLPPTAGTARVAGYDVATQGARVRDAIGAALQEAALDPQLSAREHMRLQTALYGLPKSERKQRGEELIERVGLSEAADRKVAGYSGGMKRRLDIAAGLLHEPKLLILDEPTVGLDPQSRNAILENVEHLAGEGLAVLYTTHYMEEAERLCDRVGIIDEGRIIAEGTRRELTAKIGQRDRVELSGTGRLEGFAAAAKRLKDVDDATVADGTVILLVSKGRELLPRLLEIAARSRVDVTSVEVVEPDLEAVFLHLTGKALRD